MRARRAGVGRGLRQPDGDEDPGRDANKLLAQTTGVCPGRTSPFGAWVETIPDRNLKRALPTEAPRPRPDALWPKAADVSPVGTTQLAKYLDENARSLQSRLQQLAAGAR